jgi:hypothetical protein
MSALPAASKTLFGCQSTERTVERIGFLSCFATHQLLSGSKEQIAIALWNNQGRPDIDGECGVTVPHSPCTARNGEFILERAPADKSCRTIDAQQD